MLRYLGGLTLVFVGVIGGGYSAVSEEWVDATLAHSRQASASRPRQRATPLPRRFTQPKSELANLEPARTALPGPLMVVISVGSQSLTMYDGAGVVIQSRVSTGQVGHSTPVGVFSVIEKDRYHESNIYSGAPMPFMQRITWSGIALHEGHLPGYPASHGCIRLPREVATKLFGMTKLGMRVIVSPSDVESVPFAHSALPIPVMSDAPAVQGGLQPVQVVSSGPIGNLAAIKLTPQQRALQARTRARQVAIDAVKAEKEALEASRQASAEANRLITELRVAATLVATSENQLAAARRAEMSGPADRDAATKVSADAQARLVEEQARLTEIQATEVVRSRDAFAAADAWRAANAAVERTATAAKLAEKSVEPLSVLISRKEGRLFVRQGFTPIFDAPIIINGAAPLGTHVYMAMAADEVSGTLTWTAVSVPRRPSHSNEGSHKGKSDRAIPQQPEAISTASDALDRIAIPADIRQMLNERAWLGASIIVSDHGLGSETGVGTDFVVLTK